MSVEPSLPSEVPGGFLPYSITCRCLSGTLEAEITTSHWLVERALARHPTAFARLYDRQVGGIYRYLAAWTQHRGVAEQLTRAVFRTAQDSLAALPPDSDVGAWLLALARDALAGANDSAQAGGAALSPQRALLDAVRTLSFRQRELVILHLLIGHSLAHTAHLVASTPEAVAAAELTACTTLAAMLGSDTVASADEPDRTEALPSVAAQGDGTPRAGSSAEDADPVRARALVFERTLDGPASGAPGKVQVLAGLGPVVHVADLLRSAADSAVSGPDAGFLARLREELVARVPAATATPGSGPALPRSWAGRVGAEAARRTTAPIPLQPEPTLPAGHTRAERLLGLDGADGEAALSASAPRRRGRVVAGTLAFVACCALLSAGAFWVGGGLAGCKGPSCAATTTVLDAGPTSSLPGVLPQIPLPTTPVGQGADAPPTTRRHTSRVRVRTRSNPATTVTAAPLQVATTDAPPTTVRPTTTTKPSTTTTTTATTTTATTATTQPTP